MHYKNTSSAAYDPGVEEAVAWKDQESKGSELHCRHWHRGQTVQGRLAVDSSWEVVTVSDAIQGASKLEERAYDWL